MTGTILHATELIYPGGKVENYIPLKQNRDMGRMNKSYLYKHQKFHDTRTLYVSFGSKNYDETFLRKYHLRFLKATNSAFNTVLFAVENERDIVELCAELNLHEAIRYARPNWNRVRKLR